jgi:NNP family nitrate/nitrite transporter-like MFS transporter
VSGQIAGLAGAYGNIGAVCFLSALLFVTPSTFFLLIAAASLVGTIVCWWLPEPGVSGEVDVAADRAPARGARVAVPPFAPQVAPFGEVS